MGNNFLKLKTKYVVAAILKSLVIGVSFGLLAAGAVLLSIKLSANRINFLYYILIGVGTAALSGGALFALLYKFELSDKKIAKKIDVDYELNERVQTVVEYGKEQSDILTLLREDTENRLGNLPKRKTTFKKTLGKIWYYIVIAALSVGLFLAAVLVPDRYKKPDGDDLPPIVEPDDDPAFEYALELQSRLYDLMRDVRNSNLRKTEMDGIVQLLEDLDQRVLPSIEKKSQLDIAIKTAVYAVDGIISNANTFRKVSDAVKEYDENLSKAIIEGVILYKTFSYNLVDLDMVKGLYNRVNNNIDESLESYFTSSFEAHKFTDEPYDAQVGLGEYDKLMQGMVVHGKAVYDYSGNIGASLAALTENGVNEEDGLYKALAEFKSAIDGVYRKFNGGGYTANGLNEGQDGSLKFAYDPNLKNAATEELLAQGYNCIMDVYVREKLAEIFGVSIKELGEIYGDLIPEDNKNNGDNTGDDDPNHGGFGEGDEIFGSEDLIYDTGKGEQVKYGDVFYEYYDKVDGQIKELPQDLSDFISEYFKILLNGIKKEDSEGA